MADRFYEQDNIRELMGFYVSALVVWIQIMLILLTVWTVISLGVHTYLIKRDVKLISRTTGENIKPVWLVTDITKLRDDVALEYLMMTTTSTGMIIVIPDD